MIKRLFAWLGLDQQRDAHESGFRVEIERHTCSVFHPTQPRETIFWNDIVEVEIVATGDGPEACDWYWLLHGRSAGIAVPSGARGEDQLIARLQQLPGFNNRAILEAGRGGREDRVTVWSLEDKNVQKRKTAQPGATDNPDDAQ